MMMRQCKERVNMRLEKADMGNPIFIFIAERIVNDAVKRSSELLNRVRLNSSCVSHNTSVDLGSHDFLAHCTMQRSSYCVRTGFSSRRAMCRLVLYRSFGEGYFILDLKQRKSIKTSIARPRYVGKVSYEKIG